MARSIGRALVTVLLGAMVCNGRSFTSSLSRRIGAPLVTCVGLLWGGSPSIAALTPFVDANTGISFTFPAEQTGLVLSPKLVQTHATELFFKSETVKGLSLGITVDPVKIASIREFADPPGLADKVVKVEKSKEGVFEASVLAAQESAKPVADAVPAYEIEYKIDSSRGQNHYLVKATIIDSKVYVFTVQCKEETYAKLAPAAHMIIDSVKVTRI